MVHDNRRTRCIPSQPIGSRLVQKRPNYRTGHTPNQSIVNSSTPRWLVPLLCWWNNDNRSCSPSNRTLLEQDYRTYSSPPPPPLLPHTYRFKTKFFHIRRLCTNLRWLKLSLKQLLKNWSLRGVLVLSTAHTRTLCNITRHALSQSVILHSSILSVNMENEWSWYNA